MDDVIGLENALMHSGFVFGHLQDHSRFISMALDLIALHVVEHSPWREPCALCALDTFGKRPAIAHTFCWPLIESASCIVLGLAADPKVSIPVCPSKVRGF